jgi:hypothetical protein
MNEPVDVRNLIKQWLRDVVETGNLPFESKVGGVVVQMLNVWLRSYELQKIPEIEQRLVNLELAVQKK